MLFHCLRAFPLLLCLLPAGCAGWGLLEPSVPDVRLERRRRALEVSEDFRLQRDQAEVQAARSRWARSDAAGALKLLDNLLERNPAHREARLLAAEIRGTDRRPADVDQVAHTSDGPRGQGTGRADRAYWAAASDPAENAAAQAPGEVNPARGSIDPDRLDSHRAAEPFPGDLQRAISCAVRALRQNQPALAQDLAEQALSEFPDSVRLYQVLATAHYRQGRLVESELALRQALSLDNRDPLSYFLMDLTQTRMGQAEAETRLIE